MTQKIRLATFLDVKKRGGPVDVCEHIHLPDSYPSNDSCEYTVPLNIRCDECDETYNLTVMVN